MTNIIHDQILTSSKLHIKLTLEIPTSQNGLSQRFSLFPT